MSQHPSLRISDKDRQRRSVLKRFERFGILKSKGVLKEEDSVFGLPKVKIIRVKVKKEKPAEEAATLVASEAAAQAQPQTKTPEAQPKKTEKPK